MSETDSDKFHAHDGIYASRSFGDFVEFHQGGKYLFSFNAVEWATIIAYVSVGGYSEDKYRAALALHRNDERYWSKEFSRLRALSGKMFSALTAIQAWIRSPSNNPPRFDLMDEAIAEASRTEGALR